MEIQAREDTSATWETSKSSQWKEDTWEAQLLCWSRCVLLVEQLGLAGCFVWGQLQTQAKKAVAKVSEQADGSKNAEHAV